MKEEEFDKILHWDSHALAQPQMTWMSSEISKFSDDNSYQRNRTRVERTVAERSYEASQQSNKMASGQSNKTFCEVSW